MKIYFRALDADLPSFEAELGAVPRVGEVVEDEETSYTVRSVAWIRATNGQIDPYVLID